MRTGLAPEAPLEAAKDSPARDARAGFPTGVAMERLSIEASGGLSRDLCMVRT